MNRRWICNDVWMDILPHFDHAQLGLKLAFLSPRFDVLVDKHFEGKSELTIWKRIKIHKDNLAVPKAKLSLVTNYVNFTPLPFPERPLPNKIRFKDIWIEYIDHSVVEFLRANQQIFDKDTDLDLHVPYAYNAENVQQIWNDFVRGIWPIFAQNICTLSFYDYHHLDNLRRHTSPTILTDLNQLNSIDSIDLLPDLIADDGPYATVGQALSKWLHTPTKDGKPKQLNCCDYSKPPNIKWITNFKEAFFRATTPSASYIIRFDLNLFEPTGIEGFELMNERTNEMMTLEKKKDNDYYEYAIVNFMLKRCKIGQTIQWEDKKTDNVNKVYFTLNEFGPLAPPADISDQNVCSNAAGPSSDQRNE